MVQIRTHQCRGHRFNPRSGNIPYAEEQLNLCTTTTEARMPRAWLPNKRSHRKEKPVHGNRRAAPELRSQRKPAAKKTQHSKKQTSKYSSVYMSKKGMKLKCFEKSRNTEKGYDFQCELPGLCCYRKSHILLDILYSKIYLKKVIGTHFLRV